MQGLSDSATDIYNDFVGQAFFRINDSLAGVSGGVTPSSSTGHFVAVRTGASAQNGYVNGTDQSVTPVSSGTPPNLNYVICNNNNNGVINTSSAASLMIASYGAGLTSGQVSTFCHLTNVYLTAVAGVGGGIC